MTKTKEQEYAVSNEEFFRLGRMLEQHHAVFYKFWELGRPQFSDEIETAAVKFGPHGETIDFMFNQKFWKGLSEEEKSFVICHECLHVLLEHGKRGDFKLPMLSNVAMDIAVNNILVNNFGFKRENLEIGKDGCWVDTVFENPKGIPTDQSYEFYYLKLKRECEKGSCNGKTLDDHSGFAGASEADIDKIMDNLKEKTNPEVRENLKEKLKGHLRNGGNEGGKQASQDAGGFWHSVSIGQVAKKKKWETVITKWSRKYIKKDENDEEQWARTNRRLAAIETDLLLPSEMPVDAKEESKIDVMFFLDASGSCIHLKDRFFKAALSLPSERFNVMAYSFDTRVYPVDLKKRQVRGGGGTYFHILESFVQSKVNAEKNGEYPKAIFVITDGYGDPIRPQLANRWYWFLSEGYRDYIPNECHTFMLKDFE
jgi:predicted metal-dependent peptidase